MNMIRRTLYLAVAIGLLTSALGTDLLAAPANQNIDPKTLALTLGDLPAGFAPLADRTAAVDRPDGVAVYETAFGKPANQQNLAAGPVEIRTGVARTANTDEAAKQIAASRRAYLEAGYTEGSIPPLGEESVGLSQTSDGDNGKIAEHIYIFRKNRWLALVGIRGRPEVTSLGDTVGLALVVSKKMDAVGGGNAPAAAPAAPPASTSAPSNGATSGPSLGKVKVVNADGGTVNVRAEPSTSAEVVTQVQEGTELELAGQDRQADGRTWRNVKVSGGRAGWIASKFLENVGSPAPPAAPSPAASPAAEATATQPTAASAGPGATPTATRPAAAPAATPAPTQAAPPAGTTTSTGQGYTLETQVVEPNLGDGPQTVKLRLTRDGKGVSDAFILVTMRLNPQQYIGLTADGTNGDGRTEVSSSVDGPAGSYEVLVEVRLSKDGPIVVEGKGSFTKK